MSEDVKVIRIRADMHKRLKKIAFDEEISLKALVERNLHKIEENWNKYTPAHDNELCFKKLPNQKNF